MDLEASQNMIILLGCSARWIGNHGFSIGIDDVQPKEILINKKDETLLEGYKKCDNHIQAFNKGKLELLAGCDAAQTLETRITGVLNGLRDMAGKVIICFPKIVCLCFRMKVCMSMTL